VHGWSRARSVAAVALAAVLPALIAASSLL
jgi:hypothetical protein